MEKLCKNCKKKYQEHIIYILDEWGSIYDDPSKFKEASDILDKDSCNQFKVMNNLEYLEYLNEEKNY